MKNRNLLLVLFIMLLTSAKAMAQYNDFPKREFRAAWIQTVNGQFQGMSTDRKSVV